MTTHEIKVVEEDVSFHIYSQETKWRLVSLISSSSGSAFPLREENVYLWAVYYSLQTPQKCGCHGNCKLWQCLSWPSSRIMENICLEITHWHRVFQRKSWSGFNLKRSPQLCSLAGSYAASVYNTAAAANICSTQEGNTEEMGCFVPAKNTSSQPLRWLFSVQFLKEK